MSVTVNAMKKIKLTQNKYALVDDGDYKYLSQFKWHYSKSRKTGYARGRAEGRKPSYMQHVIMGYRMVDHINGNGIDNRRKNLRYVTRSQNMRNCKIYANNTTGYKGVTRDRGLFVARIWVDNEAIYLGSSNTARGAGRLYNKASRRLHGKYGRQNPS